jgi:hypothetical protein
MHGRASRTAGYPLPRCRKAGRGARTPICCGAQWCGLELMSSARAKRRASQHRDRIAGMTPTKPSAPGPGSAHQPRPNPMACGVEQPRWRADLTALPALSVVHWHGSSSGGSRRPLPLYHGGSDVPLAVTPAAPKPGVPAFVAAEQLVQKVPQALRGFFNGFVGLIMRKREVFR